MGIHPALCEKDLLARLRACQKNGETNRVAETHERSISPGSLNAESTSIEDRANEALCLLRLQAASDSPRNAAPITVAAFESFTQPAPLLLDPDLRALQNKPLFCELSGN
jgi:hypothetical protein